MNAFIDQLLDEIRGAWRFRWAGLALAAVLAIAGWAFALSMPDKYEAKASVFVDTRTAFESVLEGLIVDDDVMSQLSYVRQSILTGERLERIAKDSGVLPPGVEGRQKAALVSQLAGQISIEAERAGADAYQSSGTVYSITFPDLDRQKAVRVTGTVMDMFIRETLGGKQESTEAREEFLAQEIREYDQRMREAENRVAEFRKKNLGLMSSDRGDYFSQLQSELDLARQAQNDLDLAQARRAELARQLRGESVISGAAMAAETSSGNDTLSRIRQTEARLAELSLRYTDAHPDVIEARNSLTELKARREAELESLRRGDAGAAAATGLSNNPIYQSTQLQLNQVDVEIASLRNKLVQHNAKAAELRQRLDVSPKVDAEYAQLNRDYDIVKATHTALLEQYEKSKLGERADTAGGMKFQIVQRPTARLVSLAAHRDLLLAGVLLGSLAAGAALTYLLSQLRPIITSVRDLGDLTDIPVLGVVGSAFPKRARHEAVRSGWQFGLVGLLLLACFVVVMILNLNGFRLAGAAG